MEKTKLLDFKCDENKVDVYTTKYLESNELLKAVKKFTAKLNSL